MGEFEEFASEGGDCCFGGEGHCCGGGLLVMGVMCDV